MKQKSFCTYLKRYLFWSIVLLASPKCLANISSNIMMNSKHDSIVSEPLLDLTPTIVDQQASLAPAPFTPISQDETSNYPSTTICTNICTNNSYHVETQQAPQLIYEKTFVQTNQTSISYTQSEQPVSSHQSLSMPSSNAVSDSNFYHMTPLPQSSNHFYCTVSQSGSHYQSPSDEAIILAFTQANLQTYSVQAFAQYFQAIYGKPYLTHDMQLTILNSIENKLNFYACDGFRQYIKTFGILYEDFMLELRQKITGKFERRLRKQYPKIGNFKNKAAGWVFPHHNDKWAFRDWAQSEVENIQSERTKRSRQAALQQQTWEKEQKEFALKKAAEQKALELKKQQEEAERQLKEREERARIGQAQKALEAQERAQRLAEEQKAHALQQAHELRVQAVASFWNDTDQREKIINKFARRAVNLHEHGEINLLKMLASESNDAIIDPINVIAQSPELEEYQRKFNKRLNARIKKIESLQQSFRQALQETAQAKTFIDEFHEDEIPAGMLEAAQAHEEKQKNLKQALKNTYAKRHASQVDQQQQLYQVFLHQLAKSYVKQADQAYLRGDTFFVQRYQERSAAIIETLTITIRPNGAKTIEHMKQIIVRDETCNFNMGGMCNKSYFGDTFSTYRDTPIDRILHSEIKATLQQTSDLINQYPDSPYTHSNATVIYHGAASARLEKNSERAWLLSDFCHYFTQATAGLVALTAPYMHYISPAVSLAHGSLNGIMYTFKSWIDHPIETAAFAVMKPLMAASTLLAQAAYTYITDQEKFYATCRGIKNANADQICYMLGYFLGSFGGKHISSKIKFCNLYNVRNRFLYAIQQQETIKLAFEGAGDFALNLNHNFKNALQPIKTVVQKAAQQVNQAGKNIANAGKNAVQGAATSIYKTLSDEVFATFGNKMPRINWKHVFYGESGKKKQLTGFHDIRSYPERIVKITESPDKNGIFKADYLRLGMIKNSSFFPQDWNRVKIMEKIKEAYNNVKETQGSGIVGETSEGIRIQMWFFKKPSGEIIINSVYPYIS